MNVLLLTMMMTVLFFTSSTFADPAAPTTNAPHPIFGTMPADFETWQSRELMIRQIMANQFATECVQLHTLKAQKLDGFENYPEEVQNLVKRLEIMETYFLKDHCRSITPPPAATNTTPHPIKNMGKKSSLVNAAGGGGGQNDD